MFVPLAHEPPGDAHLSRLLSNFDSPQLQDELEEFMQDWERLNGPVRFDGYYTSMWPREQQEWLLKTHPKRYYDGLPPFVQDYFLGKMKIAARCGLLDNMPEALVHLFVSGQMDQKFKDDTPPPTRGR
jgi:hypothetical protein